MTSNPFARVLPIVVLWAAAVLAPGQLYLPKKEAEEFQKGGKGVIVFASPERAAEVVRRLQATKSFDAVPNPPPSGDTLKAFLVPKGESFKGVTDESGVAFKELKDLAAFESNHPRAKAFEVVLSTPSPGADAASPGSGKRIGATSAISDPEAPGGGSRVPVWLWALVGAETLGLLIGGALLWRKRSKESGAASDNGGQSGGDVRGPSDWILKDLGTLRAVVGELQQEVRGNTEAIRTDGKHVHSLIQQSQSSLAEELRVLRTQFDSLKGIAEAYLKDNAQLREERGRQTEEIRGLKNDLARALESQGTTIARALEDSQASLEHEVLRRLPHLALDGRPAGPVERLQALADAAEAMAGEMRGAGVGLDAAFADQCLGELREMGRLYEKTSDPAWQPQEGDLMFLIGAVYGPHRSVETSDLSRGNGLHLRALQFECDEARSDLKALLRERYGLQELPVVPNETRFDAALHSELAGQREPTSNSERANVVFERVRPGFRRDGKILQKALVKRYVLASPSPSSAAPAPTPATPTSAEPAASTGVEEPRAVPAASHAPGVGSPHSDIEIERGDAGESLAGEADAQAPRSAPEAEDGVPALTPKPRSAPDPIDTALLEDD